MAVPTVLATTARRSCRLCSSSVIEGNGAVAVVMTCLRYCAKDIHFDHGSAKLLQLMSTRTVLQSAMRTCRWAPWGRKMTRCVGRLGCAENHLRHRGQNRLGELR